MLTATLGSTCRFVLRLAPALLAIVVLQLAGNGEATASIRAEGASPCAPREGVLAQYSFVQSEGTQQGSGACLGWGLEASDALTNSTLSGVVVIASNDVWAVGRVAEVIYGNPVGRTFVEHWDGATWTRVASPNGSNRENTLNSVAAVSSTDVWAVGQYEGDSTLDLGTLILHWNGTAWTRVPSPDTYVYDDYLYGVTAISAGNVWAVGHTQLNYNRALVLHWNGSTWQQVSLPDVGNSVSTLRAVSGTGPNDVWAVGQNSSIGGPVQAVMLHWNGTSWSVVPTPDMGPGTYLRDVTALAANDAWAVGHYSNDSFTQTYVLHWNGTAWSHVPSPNFPASNILLGVSAVSANDIWAVGTNWTITHAGFALTMHWDGTAWSLVYGPTPGNQDSANFLMSDIDAAAPDDVWAVGFSERSGWPHALIEHYSDPTTACTITFTDVPPGSTFYEYVRCMACRGVVSGYPCGSPGEPCNPNNDPYFRPNSNVTRGQLAKIVAEAANIDAVLKFQLFEDVPPGSTIYEWIQGLALNQYVVGYACGGPGEPCVPPANLSYFRPAASATRGHIAKIVSIAARLFEEPDQQMFEDVPPGSTFYAWVQRLAHLGAISGYPCGGPGEPCGPEMRPYFRPGNNVTRGQLSKIASATFYNGGTSASR